MFLTGFFLWSMDNVYCRELMKARNHVLLPWAVILEGHGWWHILTGLGGMFQRCFVSISKFRFPSAPLTAIRHAIAYTFIVWCIWLHRCLDGSEKEFKLEWSSPLKLVPQVVTRTERRASGGENGHLDKRGC
jgi:dihydroceramidase